MATTIKSTNLDFDAIKNNLKTFLQAKPEFADYNFEASGLSNILDVLAYNTHYNALVANMALNESFLGTAQLRSSLVSLSEGIGYIPDSRTSSMATVNLSVTFQAVNRPQKIELPSGSTSVNIFFGTADDQSFPFNIREDLEAVDNGSGLYEFKTPDGSKDINIFEGTIRTKTFLVGQYEDNVVYVIPDQNMDLTTAEVRVYNSAVDTTYERYTNITEAVTLSEISKLYLLKESPNGYFELSFGNGTALGQIPVAGNMVEVVYLTTAGPIANGVKAFVGTIVIPAVSSGDYTSNPIVTISPSVGGAYKESVESIRRNAPYLYASQNRMVTASDYAALVLRHYSSLISDIAAWGGQDNIVREFGKIFLAILFNTDVTPATIANTKAGIKRLADQLSVLSFTVDFADPSITYLETGIEFDFNTNLTDIPLGTMQTNVKNRSALYFEDNLGKFGQTFRLSNLLSEVDDVSPAVLSSFASVKMQQRFTPILSFANNITLRYPVAIKLPDDVNYIIGSSQFYYNGVLCSIKNRLSSTTLQVINVQNGEVMLDNIGFYESTSGKVNITSFSPESLVGGVNYVKLSAVPANTNTVDPTNNDVLYQDLDASFAIGNIVYTS